MTSLQVVAADGIGEIHADDDLAAIIATAVARLQWPDGTQGIADGDVVVVTSKIVSKAEGRVVACADAQERRRLIESETVRVLARRGETVIVETRHGLVLAAAGVDESNTAPGTLVLLPEDPDASARRLRERLQGLLRARIAVIVTDSLGRAWRLGVTEHAIGAAGVEPLLDLRGSVDHTGRTLSRTLVAVADHLAAAAGTVVRKDGRTPVTVIRGAGPHVSTHDGPGARSLVRSAAEDLFRDGRIED